MTPVVDIGESTGAPVESERSGFFLVWSGLFLVATRRALPVRPSSRPAAPSLFDPRHDPPPRRRSAGGHCARRLERHGRVARARIGRPSHLRVRHSVVWVGLRSLRGRWLLDAGARVDARADDGRTPLHYAAAFTPTVFHAEVT